MKIYISLPITGHPLEQVVVRAEKAAGYLRELGHEPVSPIELHPEQNKTDGEYMGVDIKVLIDDCDGIYFLAGWTESKGCRLEWHCARIYGKRMMFFDGWCPGKPIPLEDGEYVIVNG